MRMYTYTLLFYLSMKLIIEFIGIVFLFLNDRQRGLSTEDETVYATRTERFHRISGVWSVYQKIWWAVHILLQMSLFEWSFIYAVRFYVYSHYVWFMYNCILVCDYIACFDMIFSSSFKGSRAERYVQQYCEYTS